MVLKDNLIKKVVFFEGGTLEIVVQRILHKILWIIFSMILIRLLNNNNRAFIRLWSDNLMSCCYTPDSPTGSPKSADFLKGKRVLWLKSVLYLLQMVSVRDHWTSSKSCSFITIYAWKWSKTEGVIYHCV